MADIFVAPNKKTATTVDTVKTAENTEKNSGIQRLQENHIHALASYCQNPVGLHFKNQSADEPIFLLLRPHFITNVPWILISILLLFVPSLLSLVFAEASPLAFLPDRFTLVYLMLYYFIVFSYAFISFIHWFYNMFIITDREIVDVDFSDLVYHDVAATNIKKLEDVNYTKTGFLRSLFDYGDLFVQTAGGKENLEALAVPHPGRAAQFILSALGKANGND